MGAEHVMGFWDGSLGMGLQMLQRPTCRHGGNGCLKIRDAVIGGQPIVAAQAACSVLARVVISWSKWQMLSTSTSVNRPSGPMGARSLKGGS